MRHEILIFVILFHPTLNVVGQTSFTARSFHKHQQICNYTGTTEYDYLIQLRDDSTIVFTIFSSSFRDLYRSVTMEIYNGNFCQKKDTVLASFTTYNIFSKKRGSHPQLLSKKTNQPVKIFRQDSLLISDQNLFPVNSYLPLLNKTSQVKLNWLTAKFNSWDNNEITDKKVFGVTN